MPSGAGEERPPPEKTTRPTLRYCQILALKKYFFLHQSTVLMLDTRLASSSEELQLETLAQGVLCMEQFSHDIGGNRRRLRVEKLRGVPFLEGFHDFRIRKGGWRSFPGWLLAPASIRRGPRRPSCFGRGQVDLVADGPSVVGTNLASRPHLALVDIGLPGIGGYEVARRVCAQRPDGVMLVAMTGYGLEQDRERALAAGFDEHLVKPVEPGRLFQLLAEVAGPRKQGLQADRASRASSECRGDPSPRPLS